MKRRILLLVAAIAVVLAGSIESQTHAQRRGGRLSVQRSRVGLGLGNFGGTSITTLFDLYRNRDIPIPPYFALHPPVYYSHPVPRPYGYSPFAYPGWVKTPEVFGEVVEPATIINPYVPSSQSESEEPSDRLTRQEMAEPKSKSTVTPLVIVNPYVEQQVQVVQAGR